MTSAPLVDNIFASFIWKAAALAENWMYHSWIESCPAPCLRLTRTLTNVTAGLWRCQNNTAVTPESLVQSWVQCLVNIGVVSCILSSCIWQQSNQLYAELALGMNTNTSVCVHCNRHASHMIPCMVNSCLMPSVPAISLKIHPIPSKAIKATEECWTLTLGYNNCPSVLDFLNLAAQKQNLKRFVGASLNGNSGLSVYEIQH